MHRIELRFSWIGATLAVLLIVVFLTTQQPPESPAANGIVAPIDLIDALAAQWVEVEPGSPEALRLMGEINQVRAQASKTQADAENPGAFLEALAQLKTTRDGRTYAPNYKMTALRRAQVRVAGKAAVPQLRCHVHECCYKGLYFHSVDSFTYCC